MKYSFESNIRYSEAGSNGTLTITGLVDYFQDCSIFHSESIRLGLDYLDQANTAWILTNWRILFYRMPALTEKVRISTWANQMRGFYGLRNFTLEDARGELLAVAETMWVYMDMEKGRPIRIPPELTTLYDPEEAYPLPQSPRRIQIPEAYEEREHFTVPAFFIDTNRHMNNSRYVQVAETYLPDDFAAAEMRVEYRNSARLGDEICPRITQEEKRLVVNLTDTTGKTYAVVEFLCEQ